MDAEGAMTELLYEGKAKQVYATDNPDYVIQYFKDDATAFNAKKRGTIVSKGMLNNQMSEIFFRLLEARRHADALRRAAERARDAGEEAARSFRWRPSCATSSPAAWRSAWASKKGERCRRRSSSTSTRATRSTTR